MSDRVILKGNSKLLQPLITEVLAIYQIIESKDIGIFYGSVDSRETVRRVGKPKVTLYFLEDSNFNKKASPNKINEGRRRQEGIIRFRLMNETTHSFSKANGIVLGTKIKEIFGANGGFVWNKGKTMYSYNDWERGYQFQLLCRTEVEAKRIITAVHSLQNHIPNWQYLNLIKNDQEASKYPENPGNQVVMGETIPIVHSRPLVDVRFQYAYVKLDGVKEPINLYSLKGKRVGTLVS